MEQQFYQPLSAALHAPLVQNTRSPQPHYASYPIHTQPSTSNGTSHRDQREEEEEDEEDDDGGDDDPDHAHRDHQSHSAQSSPHANASKPAANNASASSSGHYAPQASASARDDQEQNVEDSKRKPGRPRGSRNRKPRAPASTTNKAPANSQHPGFYQYPPAPGTATSQQNQQFYDFQWRVLHLCSEFYNAAEELIKGAPPMVVAQCYHSGPATKVDPLALIAEAKRVCDNLLANPSQLAGQQPPPAPAYAPVAGYGAMPPPPPPGTTAAAPAASGPVINNPQSFVMPLGAAPLPPPGYAPQPYYTGGYPPGPGTRYPTAPYYSYPPQPTAPYYPPQAQTAPPNSNTPVPTSSSPSAPAPAPTAPAPTPAPPAHPPATTAPTQPAAPAVAQSTSAGTSSVSSTPTQAPPGVPTSASGGHPPPSPAAGLSTFNAATGNIAPGGTQGAWSEEETERLKKLAEKSRETAGGKGDIEWDWVVSAWGNSRTRHQILLKATSLGLKESTTRGQKRRRDTDAEPAPRSQPAPPSYTPTQTNHVTIPSPAQSSATSNPPSANASPATQPMRPPSSAPQLPMAPPRSASSTSKPNIPWPMPTVAANTPSPIMAHNQIETTQTNYYGRHPTQPTGYGTATTAATNVRPPSSHGGSATHHQYMYRPNGADASSGRR